MNKTEHRSRAPERGAAHARIRGASYGEMYSFFERVTGRAYRRTCLAANPVLARSPYTAFVRRYIQGDSPRLPWWTLVPKFLFSYAWNNGKALAKALGDIRRTARALGRDDGSPVPATCIDAVVSLPKAIREQRISIENHPTIEDEFQARDLDYFLAATLHPAPAGDDLKALHDVVREKGGRIAFYCGLFTLADALRLAWFFLAYPVALLAFLCRTPSDGRAARLLKDECVRTMGCDVIPAYLRYLNGLGLARLRSGPLTVIGWNENRASDKLFAKGLRAGNPEAAIVAVQTFLCPHNYIGYYVNRAERALGYEPDKIIVNGPYYLSDMQGIPMDVGTSYRYEPLLRNGFMASRGREVLVLLSYDQEASQALLAMLSGLSLPDGPGLLVKPHPSQSAEWLAALLPPGAAVADGTVLENLTRALAAVGTETGALIEAVAAGIPAIEVDTLRERSLEYMPDLGKDEVWFQADSAESIASALDKAAAVSDDTRRTFSGRYLEDFFSANPLATSLAPQPQT